MVRSETLRKLETERRSVITSTHKLTWPRPSWRRYLFTSLSAAGFSQNSLPFNITFVVGVDGGVDVKSVLQNLPSAGVDHRPLLHISSATASMAQRQSAKKLTRVGVSLGTQEMKIILLLHSKKSS